MNMCGGWGWEEAYKTKYIFLKFRVIIICERNVRIHVFSDVHPDDREQSSNPTVELYTE